MLENHLSLVRRILHSPPRLKLGVLNGWIRRILTVSVTDFILRCTVPFVLTCCMRYGPLYGCSYFLRAPFRPKTSARFFSSHARFVSGCELFCHKIEEHHDAVAAAADHKILDLRPPRVRTCQSPYKVNIKYE